MKTCKHPTCGATCRRVKAEKKRTPMKRTRIKQVSKKKAKENREEAKITKLDKAMYAEIWEERAHVDFETGELIMSPATLNFHHVLPKKDEPGGYPQFRHEKWNVVLVSWNTHTKAERNIDLVPKIKAYRDYLLKTYVK